MSFGDDGASQQKVVRERDRLKLLLDINNAVVSQLALAELLTLPS